MTRCGAVIRTAATEKEDGLPLRTLVSSRNSSSPRVMSSMERKMTCLLGDEHGTSSCVSVCGKCADSGMADDDDDDDDG